MPVVIHRGAAGKVKWAIHAHDDELAQFSASEQNTAIRTALLAGGELFIDTYVMMRFSDYARKLGYGIASNWLSVKLQALGKAIPFVGLTPPGGGRSGGGHKATNPEKMIVAVMRGTRATATATSSDGGRHTISILIPFGHPLRPSDADIFTTVLPAEIDAVAERVRTVLEDILDKAEPTDDGKGVERTIQGSHSRIDQGGGTPARGAQDHAQRAA